MPRFWTRSLIRLGLLVLLGVGIGAIYGEVLAGALVSSLVALGWQLFNLFRLERWLNGHPPASLPRGRGIWPRVFADVARLKQGARNSRKRWRQLVKELRSSAKAFPDGGVILNSRNEILNYNKAARSLLGLRKRRDKGQRIDNLIRHPEFIRYLQEGSAKESVEIQSPTGGEVWLSLRLIPYGPSQSLLLVRDITQAIRVERMRRDFVANASHELRSPLTVITGYLDTLADDSDIPSAWKQPVSDMREQAERMGQLVRDLLQLSKLESGRVAAKDKLVDLDPIILGAEREVRAMPDHPRHIEIDLDSDALIRGEETEIQSIVTNLVSNAVLYTDRDGTVSISWKVDDAGGHLAVADTGIGIAEGEISRVTERFFRGSNGRLQQRSGTGLGLAIVKHALKRHDAELEIVSKLGQGSTFSCHFPPDRLAFASAKAQPLETHG